MKKTNMNWEKAIFLAHATEDKPIVRRLYDKLKSEGLNPWLDEKSLEPGTNWKDAIKEAIKKSRIFMACISKNSVKKNGFVQNELRQALQELESKPSNTVYFIPVLLEYVALPNVTVGTISLSDFHAINIQSKENEAKLISSLKKIMGLGGKEVQNINKNRVKNYIANDKIQDAIELLKYWSEETEIYNTIVLLEQRYTSLRKAYLNSIVSNEFYRVEENSIIVRLLAISDHLDEIGSPKYNVEF